MELDSRLDFKSYINLNNNFYNSVFTRLHVFIRNHDAVNVYTWQLLLFRLCEEFEQIAERALSTPMDTAELMELREYMSKVEKETVIQLEEKLQQAGERLAFLIEYSISSPQEMRSKLVKKLHNSCEK